MGNADSKHHQEDEFEIHKLQDNGDTLLRSKKDAKQYLMRVITCASQSDLERLKTLLENRAQIKSNHLLELVEIKEKQKDFVCSIQYRMYLVLEYSFKNVEDEIIQRSKLKHPFQESDLWSIIYSCCTALQALYAHGNSHQCLTGKQIFINKEGFVKMSEPLLFGLEKNHLQAMRTKEDGCVSVHLSPEIMNCLEDQNFFYYDKQKSDIFILGMIMADLALLETNYLYDVAKKRPKLECIDNLIRRVEERYNPSLAGVLSLMLNIDSKFRPTLQQLIDRVEKCNHIGEDFTLQTESKENQESSQIEQEPFEKPVKYRELQIQNAREESVPPQRGVYNPGRVVVGSNEQTSLSINDVTSGLNQLNFEGRVFNRTPHESYYTHHMQTSISGQPKQFHVHSVHQQLRPGISFDLYERSRSIDSIKIPANVQEQQHQMTVPKKGNPFNLIANVCSFSGLRDSPQTNHPTIRGRSTLQAPIFTHQIPEVYNLMVKNSRNTMPNGVLKDDKEHVSTPQFQGQAGKNNRFTSFKNMPHETVSRFADDNETHILQQVQLRKNSSHTQSETHKRNIPLPGDLDSFARQAMSPNAFPSNITFMAPNNTPFTLPSAFPSHGAAFPAQRGPQTGTAFNAISSVSVAMTPSKGEFGRRSEAFTCRSGFTHLSERQETPQPKLHFVKEDIPERGRYEGYKSEDGMRKGHGVLYFKDGGHYEGEWSEDKMHGFGKLYYENGSIAYEGHWERDEFNGQGRVYNMDPVSFSEDFNFKDFSELGNRWSYYDGQFKGDSKHGKGYIKLTNGQMFEGLFDHDMIEGNGIFYKRSGEIVVGFWIDNKLFLNQSYEKEIK